MAVVTRSQGVLTPQYPRINNDPNATLKKKEQTNGKKGRKKEEISSAREKGCGNILYILHV